MADKTFLGVEIYRHTTDLASRDRAWCAANATLRYEGTNQSFNDTGLTAGTTYYYKIFGKYDVDGSTYYSSGATASQTTSVAPPVLVSAATNTAGTVITLTFDKAMANPSGKHGQFSAVVAGTSRSFTAAALNADTTKIDLTLASAVTSGQVVTVSYTAGDVAASDTSPLASFSGQSVTNNVVSLYQQWSGYPQTPNDAATATYPYQCIYNNNTDAQKVLIVSDKKLYRNGLNNTINVINANVRFYKYNTSTQSWVFWFTTSGSNSLTNLNAVTLLQANADIYTDSSFTTIYFAKTTP